MSALGYTYMVQLNNTEFESYESAGREFLRKLAHDIHDSVPIAKNTGSLYKDRDVSSEFSDLATEAVKIWRDTNNER